MNVFITGTSSGIGKGLAQEFVSRGHAVWGVSRRDTSFDDATGTYVHCNVDLTDFDAVKKLIPDFISDVHVFDLVILNAGVLGDIALMPELDVVEMKRVMESIA